MLHRVLSQKAAEIIYLVDDDIWSAPDDGTLPEKYRTKLAGLTTGLVGECINRASHIVVSSNILSDKVPANIPVSKLSPCWHIEPPDEKHFNQEYIKLVHLGTNSHKAGYEFLRPILENVLDKTSHVTFTYYSNTSLLGALDKHPRIIRQSLMRWKKYKKHIGKKRFHLGLYPILDTPFNQGRSHNKILEYCLTGCAAVFSKNWYHSGLIEHGTNGWLCNNNQQDWSKVILSLVEKPRQLQTVFAGASQLFGQLNDLQYQRAFWKHLLLKE